MENEKYEFELNLDELIEQMRSELRKTVTVDEYIDFVNYCQSKKRRELYLHGEVEYCSIQELIDAILEYNREDCDKDPSERKPIWLHIYSQGGDVVAGNALIDVMLQSKTPVYTVNDALAASMAGLIFLAGRKRYSMERATIMLHDGSLGISGDVSKVMDYIGYQNKWESKMRNFVLSHSKLTEEEYDKQSRADWYLLPDFAKEKGIVDYIVGEDCELKDILPC